MTLTEPSPYLPGQLIVGGFSGETLPPAFERALAERRRGGAILFKRNLPNIAVAHALCSSIVAASPSECAPLIGVDQEGGRVVRLPAPALRLPAMATLAAGADLELLTAAGERVGEELSALGFNLNFAPVLDVNTEAANPVIGDRAFGSEPGQVIRAALAYWRGLQNAGVIGCGKHFPGHGDTHLDSHYALPVVSHARARLESVELAPFRAGIEAGMPALMSAHVVYTALDAEAPATLSAQICSELLRRELGFRGVLFSDDLEMKALAGRGSIAELAVQAVRAGCDAVLVCSDEAAQERVFDALVRESDRDPAFEARCRSSVQRLLQLSAAHPPRPCAVAELAERVGGPKSLALARLVGC